MAPTNGARLFDQPAEDGDGRGDSDGQRLVAGTGPERERHRSAGEPEEGELDGECRDVRDRDAPAADGYADDQSRPGCECDGCHDGADRYGLGSDQSRASDRVGEHQPEDSVLLLAGGGGGGPGDREGADHERAVERCRSRFGNQPVMVP